MERRDNSSPHRPREDGRRSGDRDPAAEFIGQQDRRRPRADDGRGSHEGRQASRRGAAGYDQHERGGDLTANLGGPEMPAPARGGGPYTRAGYRDGPRRFGRGYGDSDGYAAAPHRLRAGDDIGSGEYGRGGDGASQAGGDYGGGGYGGNYGPRGDADSPRTGERLHADAGRPNRAAWRDHDDAPDPRMQGRGGGVLGRGGGSDFGGGPLGDRPPPRADDDERLQTRGWRPGDEGRGAFGSGGTGEHGGERSGGRHAGPAMPAGGDSARREDEGPHRGRGPKGYTRSDERLREDICERLTDDAHLDASDIEVEVSDGVVTLSGTVENRWLKYHAEDLVDRCAGVRDIHNRLSSPRRSRGD